jgi:cobalt-precorrin 5A hydrolase/precorrin-3B C17-methyltransferase
VGCSTNGDPREAVELVHTVLDEYGLAASGVASVATLDRRIDHAAPRAVAAALGAELVSFPANDLDGVAVPTGSPSVRAAVGTGSVAEAAAILAAGGGEILVTKRSARTVTVAVAERRP